jgi:hypothetical protein
MEWQSKEGDSLVVEYTVRSDIGSPMKESRHCLHSFYALFNII